MSYNQSEFRSMTSRYFFFIFLSFSFQILLAQEQVKGTIQEYDGGAAEIILPSQNPRIIGSVTKQGEVTIELEDDMANEMTQSMEEANKESENIRIVNKSVGRAFYCDSEEVVTVNGDEIIESITIQGMFFMGILEEKKPIGKFQIGSSKSFVDSYFSLGKKDFETGYYIDFYYVNQDASVNGVCMTKTYTLDMKDTFYLTHHYTIDLKKGWNIVKIGVTEVYKDQEGHIRPLKYEMTTLDELPDDAQFIFTPGDKL